MLFFRINNWSQSVQLTDNQNDIKYLPLVLSFLLLIPFHWRETKLFTRQVKVQSRQKYFNHNNYKGNMRTLAEKKTNFTQFFPLQTASFPSFDGKYRGLIIQKLISK